MSKSKATDQNIDQQIKSYFNRSKVNSTDQKLDQHIKINLDALFRQSINNLDEIYTQFRCNIDAL